jgi:hypothetical protein
MRLPSLVQTLRRGRAGRGQTTATATPVDLAAFGLPPDDRVVTDETLGHLDLIAAIDATRGGNWQVAAELLRASRDQADLRGVQMRALGVAAVSDDAWLTSWENTYPDDQDARVLRAETLAALAWAIRGRSRLDKISDARVDGFQGTLREAVRVAESAAKLRPDDAEPWAVQVRAARGLRWSRERFGEVWGELVERFPHHRIAHTQALQYHCSKWLRTDNEEALLEFTERAASTAPLGSPLVLLRLEAVLELWNGGEEIEIWRADSTMAAIDTALTHWLGAGGARHPYATADRNLLALALTLSGRYAEAVEQFRHIGRYAGQYPWNSFDDYRAKFCQVREMACLGSVEGTPPCPTAGDGGAAGDAGGDVSHAGDAG